MEEKRKWKKSSDDADIEFRGKIFLKGKKNIGIMREYMGNISREERGIYQKKEKSLQPKNNI